MVPEVCWFGGLMGVGAIVLLGSRVVAGVGFVEGSMLMLMLMWVLERYCWFSFGQCLVQWIFNVREGAGQNDKGGEKVFRVVWIVWLLKQPKACSNTKIDVGQH